MTVTAKIRQAARELALFSAGDLACADYDCFISRKQVHSAIQEFKRMGEIERLSDGRYRYLQGRDGRSRDVQERIYRAIHIKGIFSARDVVVLTDGSKTYVPRVINRLLENGELEKVGRRSSTRGGKETVYKVRSVDRFYRRFVKP